MTQHRIHLFISLALVLAFASCKRTLCKDVDCIHGVCEYGTCICEDGWDIGTDGKCSKKLLCYGVDCGHGDCLSVDGSCQCEQDYELDSTGKCNKLFRERYLGSWTGYHIDNNNDTVGPYTMVVTAVSGDNQLVQIANFANYQCGFTGTGLVVNARVTLATSILDFQAVCAGISVTATWTYLDPTHFSTNVWLSVGNTTTHSTGLFERQ